MSQKISFCLLYTSDAADDLLCVDLGGRRIIKKRVETALFEVGLKGTGNLWPYQLSGGMVKRVALARAIILDPLLVLYDEPFTALDPISLKQVCDVLLKVRGGNLATQIMVSLSLIHI